MVHNIKRYVIYTISALCLCSGMTYEDLGYEIVATCRNGFIFNMHVEAFLCLLTRWATALSWKQQIQNGTNFEQAKIYSSKHSAKRKNYDRGKKWF